MEFKHCGEVVPPRSQTRWVVTRLVTGKKELEIDRVRTTHTRLVHVPNQGTMPCAQLRKTDRQLCQDEQMRTIRTGGGRGIKRNTVQRTEEEKTPDQTHTQTVSKTKMSHCRGEAKVVQSFIPACALPVFAQIQQRTRFVYCGFHSTALHWRGFWGMNSRTIP